MIVTNPRTAYDQRALEVRQRIIDLCLALAAHAKEAGEVPSWGHVGDLCNADQRLKDIVEFVGPRPKAKGE